MPYGYDILERPEEPCHVRWPAQPSIIAWPRASLAGQNCHSCEMVGSSIPSSGASGSEVHSSNKKRTEGRILSIASGRKTPVTSPARRGPRLYDNAFQQHLHAVSISWICFDVRSAAPSFSAILQNVIYATFASSSCQLPT